MRSYIAQKFIAIVLSAAHGLYGQSIASAGRGYEGLPPGYDFPANEDRLLSYVAHDDVHSMRRHAWFVFQGLTLSSALGGGIPKWQTWYDTEDVFPTADNSTHLSPDFKLRTLEVPEELRSLLSTPMTGLPVTLLGVPVSGSQAGPGEVIYYNREAYCQILACGFNLQKTLHRLKDDGLTIDFPRTSIALKTSWMYVPRSGVTRIGVWNFQRKASGLVANPKEGWPEQVKVCPKCGKSDPFWSLYSIPIHEEELAQVRSVHGFERAESGGYAALVGLHFATRELRNWLWATFWWHLRPSQGIYAEDRPATLDGVWRNYLMTISYDMDRPWEADARPRVAYNPYLEGAFWDGVSSNCMTCHRRATWPLDGNSPVTVLFSDNSRGPVLFPSTVVRGSEAATSTYFNVPYEKLLKTSFLWTLALRALPDVTKHPPTIPPDCKCQNQN